VDSQTLSSLNMYKRVTVVYWTFTWFDLHI